MRTKKILFSVIFGILLLLFGAYFFLFTNIGWGLSAAYENWKKGDPSTPAKNEIVMPPHATVTAETKTGTITIKSGEGLKRYYIWDGVTRSVVMWPRHNRWYGSLGLYYPGPGSHWLPKHNGISRGVLQEGQQHFKTIQEAMDWLEKHKQWYPTVYRDDGLVIGFGKTIQREQINVDVWQIYINGEKPTKLEGSNNKTIKTSWDK